MFIIVVLSGEKQDIEFHTRLLGLLAPIPMYL